MCQQGGMRIHLHPVFFLLFMHFMNAIEIQLKTNGMYAHTRDSDIIQRNIKMFRGLPMFWRQKWNPLLTMKIIMVEWRQRGSSNAITLVIEAKSNVSERDRSVSWVNSITTTLLYNDHGHDYVGSLMSLFPVRFTFNVLQYRFIVFTSTTIYIYQ